MLGALRQLIQELAGTDSDRRFTPDDHRLSAAALLYHVIAVDGLVTEGERRRLNEALRARYGLDDAAAQALVREAQAADEEAVDLYHFTSVLKTHLDLADREAIIALMWDLVYEDGKLDEVEDNIIWRVAELLGVSSRTRMELKRKTVGDTTSV